MEEVNPTSAYLHAAPGASVDLLLDPSPRSVTVARHAVGRLLEGARLSPSELSEDVLLLVSELVTNAVIHAGTVLRVVASVEAGQVLVSVSDDDPDHAPQEPQRGVLATSGRGLRLVDLLATSWGVKLFGTSKVVWFEVGSGPDRPQYVRQGTGA